ncbi:MAG: YdcF family protein [Gudongella sp.]|nr:YdcF family protein [Gudongella sp.]
MKVNKKCIMGLLIVIVSYFVIVHNLIQYEAHNYPDSSADYLIVLGARLYGDIPSPSLRDRLDIAIDNLKQYPNTKVIVSGGQGDDEWISEAAAMKKYLIEKEIESGRIIVESESTNTLENIRFSLEKIKEQESNNDFSIIVVTNKYHIFRAKFLAKRVGLRVRGLPAEIPPTVVIPSYFREYFAVLKSAIFDW